MIKLLFQTIKEKILHILNALRTPQMIFSHDQKSVSLKLIGSPPHSQMLRSTAGKVSTLGKDIP